MPVGWLIGGDEGDRTPDLCNAIAALSQLSYVPEICRASSTKARPGELMNLAEMPGIVKHPPE
jgi:hypothetical protein